MWKFKKHFIKTLIILTRYSYSNKRAPVSGFYLNCKLANHFTLKIKFYYSQGQLLANIYLFKETLKKVWNMFKVNNKTTRTTSFMSLWCLHRSGLFIVNFEYISNLFLVLLLMTYSTSILRFARNFYWNCPFPQNFHTRKLGQISVFYSVFILLMYELQQ